MASDLVLKERGITRPSCFYCEKPAAYGSVEPSEAGDKGKHRWSCDEHVVQAVADRTAYCEAK